jgi:hypothetical protein
VSRSNPKAVTDPSTGETRLTKRLSPPRKDKVFRRLEASVPREEWLASCEASSDERAQALLARLLDPSCRKHSLPQLAKEVGLTYPQVLKLVTNYRLDQGLLRMSAHVPQVLEDVAIDSESKLIACPACQGSGQLETVDRKTGEITDTKACWSCDATGKLRKVGDADSRKLMLETLGLTGRRGPMIAQQFINAGGQSVEDALDTVASVLDVKAEVPTP